MKKRITPLLFLGYFGIFIVLLIVIGYFWSRSEERRSPQQPIAFSHELHAGRLNLECTFCHKMAPISIHAGVPSLQKCMSCHSNVATDRAEIKKLTEYWNNKQPVLWERIHKLPDHVYFPHKRHIKAGIDCSACHGQVETMARIRQVRTLEMGWCVDCHKLNNAPGDCWTCHK